MSQHSLYRFSLTVKTDEEAVLHCMRALSQFAQKSGNVYIPWRGTKKQDWDNADNCVTFRFSRPDYRNIFKSELDRLLPKEYWEIKGESDDDPPRIG